MKLDINGAKYTVSECGTLEPGLRMIGRQCRGTTDYQNQIILIDMTFPIDAKRNTLRHELAHAFIRESQIDYKAKFDEEMMCEFMAIYGPRIVEMTEQFYPKEVNNE